MYEKVKIRRVDALGINIQHKDGFTRVDFRNLPDDLQERFQFSEKDAEQLAHREKKNVAASVHGGEQYKLARRILDLKTKILAANQNIARLSSEVQSDRSRIAANKSKIATARERAAHYRALPNQGMNWDKAKKYERRIDSLGKQSVRLQSVISRNQAAIGKSRRDLAEFKSEKRSLERSLKQLKEKQ